jgi:hypothetical protein
MSHYANSCRRRHRRLRNRFVERGRSVLGSFNVIHRLVRVTAYYRLVHLKIDS